MKFKGMLSIVCAAAEPSFDCADNKNANVPEAYAGTTAVKSPDEIAPVTM